MYLAIPTDLSILIVSKIITTGSTTSCRGHCVVPCHCAPGIRIAACGWGATSHAIAVRRRAAVLLQQATLSPRDMLHILNTDTSSLRGMLCILITITYIQPQIQEPSSTYIQPQTFAPRTTCSRSSMEMPHGPYYCSHCLLQSSFYRIVYFSGDGERISGDWQSVGAVGNLTAIYIQRSS